MVHLLSVPIENEMISTFAKCCPTKMRINPNYFLVKEDIIFEDCSKQVQISLLNFQMGAIKFLSKMNI